jgi:hypothetical protein
MVLEFSLEEVIGYIFGLISIAVTVVYAIKGNIERNATKALIQSEYNSHYIIARACSRAREFIDNLPQGGSDYTDLCNQLIRKLEIIRGTVDTSRGYLIAHGKQFFPREKIPRYTHPAYPDLDDQPDEVKLGMTPDEYNDGKKRNVR